MAKLNSNGFKFMLCFAAGLIWGALIGSSLTAIIVSYRMDTFYEKIAYQESVLEEKDEKLEKLEKLINNSNIILKDIEINLEKDGKQINNIDSIEIEKAIKEKFSSSLGKEVNSLDADILVEVIDKRIFKYEEAEYQLNVKKLVLSDTLKLWIEITVIEIETQE